MRTLERLRRDEDSGFQSWVKEDSRPRKGISGQRGTMEWNGPLLAVKTSKLKPLHLQVFLIR